MPITFDTAAKRIILDSASVTATEIYSRWVDWAATSDNLKYGMVIRQVGSDDLGGGLSIPPYYFLQGAWRVRPMESSHTLIITGNLFVEGGGVPVVNTLGSYNVAMQYTVPVQAQGISTSGSTAPTADQVADAVRAELAVELARLLDLAKINGLVAGTSAVVTATSRTAGDVSQTISEAAGTVTVSRA
jgi:hypothetical protein